MKDALYMLSDAWYEGSPESICKAYDKLKIHSDNSESNSQPEFREDNIAESMVEMLEHVQQLDNEEMPNAPDVEDWLNLENELPTSPQMSDEEILAPVVGDSTESEIVCSDEEDEGEDEKLVSSRYDEFSIFHKDVTSLKRHSFELNVLVRLVKRDWLGKRNLFVKRTSDTSLWHTE